MHNDQLKLNNNNPEYNNSKINNNAMYGNDVASGIEIGQTPA
jgi:hypothetical protein